MQNKRRRWFFIPTVLLLSLAFLALVGFFGVEYYAMSVLKQEIDKQIQEISRYVRVEYDSMKVNWLAFTVDVNKVRMSRPPLPGRITIDKVAVRDLTSIGIRWIPTVVVLNDLSLVNEDFKITAHLFATSFTLNRIPTEEEIERKWQVLLENLSDGKLRLDNIAYSDKDTQLNIGHLKTNYSTTWGNLKNIGIEINDTTFQSANIRSNSQAISLAVSLDRNDVLRHLSQKIKDFSFHFPADWAENTPIVEKLNSLGYDRLAFGVDFNYDYQPDTKDLHMTWDGSAKDMGQLQLDLNLTDYHSPPVPVDGGLVRFLEYLEKLRNPVQKASLRGFTASYRDSGLAPRLIKAEAQSRGMTSEELTRDLVGSINATLALFPLPATVKEQVNSINRFLLNPQEIQLAITCKPPVRLKNLEEGSVLGFLDLFAKSEIKITAK
jgi:hypothetical protein